MGRVARIGPGARIGETANGDPGAGGAKISARGNGYHFAGWIAPDLSHACWLHCPGYDRSPASPNPAKWYIHGAAQNRRGTVLTVSHILGAPSSSPHRRGRYMQPATRTIGYWLSANCQSHATLPPNACSTTHARPCCAR